MRLTEKLVKFQGKLDRGKIDWKFIFNHPDIEEGNAAADMLINRGFVRLLDLDEEPSSYSDYWVVVDNSGEVVNPSFRGKRLYFVTPKFARAYLDYLKSLDRRRGYGVFDFH